MKAINLNREVLVKLTQYGVDIYRRHFNKYKLEKVDTFEHVFAKATNMEGYTKFQLYELMKIFGNDAFSGNENFFVDSLVHFPEKEFTEEIFTKNELLNKLEDLIKQPFVDFTKDVGLGGWKLFREYKEKI